MGGPSIDWNAFSASTRGAKNLTRDGELFACIHAVLAAPYSLQLFHTDQQCIIQTKNAEIY